MVSFTIDLIAHVTTFLDKPSGSACYVPDAYAAPAKDALVAAGFALSRAVAAAPGHAVDATVIRLGADRKADLDRALAIVFGESLAKRLECLPAMCKKAIVPLVVPKDVVVEFHDKPDLLELPKDRHKRLMAFDEYQKPLRLLAQVSGLAVHFHSDSSGIRAPFPEEPGVVRVVTNACPPGQAGARYAAIAFGMKVNEDGLAVYAWGPTKGRGRTLTDDHGEPVVQLMGSTWYLLLPTLSNFNHQTSTLIFGRLMELAWREHRAAAKPKAKRKMTAKAFAEAAGGWADDMGGVLDAELRKIERRIVDAQRDLADAIRQKKEWTALREGFRSTDFVAGSKKRFPKDFAAIAKDPLVAGVELVDEGFHVTTKPIEIAREGHRYRMGEYVVRVSKRGAVSVWSVAATHAAGIQHPHIPRDGGPCLGNASDAIAKAAGEQRYADCLRYVLRWLTEGYTPALAEVKLEAWPRVGESPDHYEARRLADIALAKAADDAVEARVRPRSAKAAKAAAAEKDPEPQDPIPEVRDAETA